MKKMTTFAASAVFATLLFSNQASADMIEVKSGDTLWGLSRTYDTTVNAIKEGNDLHSDIIRIGQRLNIPGTSIQAKTSSATGTYRVVRGDSLWKIAMNNGMTVAQLKQLNGLTKDIIYVGQTLKLSGVENVTVQTETIEKATVANSSSIDVNQMINEAKKYIGTPYVWGGTTPSGFDCSGFMYYVIKQQKPHTRTNVAGYWNMMKSVSKPNVGDFVYFETYKKGPSHMGIYLGNGQFIHAGSSRGVEISNMNSSYWSPRYLGARSL